MGAISGIQQMPADNSPRGFLEQAGIGEFSMCFNPGSDGVLRMGEPQAQDPLTNIGQEHWGLDFRGVTVGGVVNENVSFCRTDQMQAGQQTPCGAIPDSGTTTFMAPPEHVSQIMDEI